jgi:hypothetical protein
VRRRAARLHRRNGNCCNTADASPRPAAAAGRVGRDMAPLSKSSKQVWRNGQASRARVSCGGLPQDRGAVRVHGRLRPERRRGDGLVVVSKNETCDCEDTCRSATFPHPTSACRPTSVIHRFPSEPMRRAHRASRIEASGSPRVPTSRIRAGTRLHTGPCPAARLGPMVLLLQHGRTLALDGALDLLGDLRQRPRERRFQTRMIIAEQDAAPWVVMLPGQNAEKAS